ncbi:M28 family metallopeptidase [Streptomyces lavendulae]|uniref:Leupeptin-inactivating enzyme 1 n=1 Tax=Streptomyces lavendulae subsp. lavendulae TaxID=58340 RepID=A0A2K8PIV9_STRLA|nr:M28 family metallopeptidase [Streptomyces lavendulae]ATZ26671.1 Leupeptin-inactivating enzyme 1 precursor [Streptomyces lavendulae subsp. lavendulae]QUQ56499.1 putative lipoprotein aminopeptidase LpqL [Streptomyces lavendulae subsp. lavendulae]
MRDIRHRRRSIPALAALAAAAVAAPLLIAAAPASAHDNDHRDRRGAKLAKELVEEVTARGAYRHLAKFQQIADANGGNRAAGTPGHAASAAYVHDTLKKAGYDVSYQDFDIYEAHTRTEKTTVLGAGGRELATAAFTFTRSTPAGGLVAPLALARVDETPGCTADDYPAGAFTGKIALVKRGACTFVEKQRAAAAAGAVGVIVYNHSGTTPVRGGFSSPSEGVIPSAGITLADGEALAAAAAAGEVKVRLDLDQEHVKKTTRNVIAETRGGRADRVVALGSHLDSVPEGPGINDNGSGSAGLLEVALKLADEGANKKGKGTANKVRFAWWSAEELGLLGSEHYVAQLNEKQKKDIALYLNFDMIASPNPAQFVYDGDDSDKTGEGAGPAGSAQIEALINGFLDKKGKPHEGSDFDGRSDYGPFIANGIPAGGTFTGAEGVKTAEQAKRYGGTAGSPYDPNYHGAGDTLKNLDLKAFDTNLDVIAHAVGTYAQDLSSIGK